MKEVILRNLQGKKILIFFLLATSIYFTMLLSTIKNLTELAGGMQPLDMLPLGYDQNYVVELLDRLGKSGQEYYLYRQLPLDFLYPGLFAITYSLLFAYLLKKIGQTNSRYFYFSYLPIMAGAADYLENITIISFIKSYPNIAEISVKLGTVFSITKSFTTTCYYIALIILLIVFGIGYRSRKRETGLNNPQHG